MNKALKKYLLLLLLPIAFACERERNAKQVTEFLPQTISKEKAGNISTIDIDAGKSLIQWRGTKMRGLGSHEGTLQLKEGKFLFRGDSLVGGAFVADMEKITITDIPKHDVIPIRNLTSHLKKEFRTDKYPTATFEITQVRYLKEDSLLVWGNMRIKDVRKNIRIPVKIRASHLQHRQFHTEFVLNRFAWTIGEDGSWLEKKVVDPEFRVRLQLVPIRSTASGGIQ